MSTLNNFGIWKNIIIMDEGQPPRVKKQKKNISLFKEKWLTKQKYQLKFLPTKELQQTHKFLERIDIKFSFHKCKITKILKQIQAEGILTFFILIYIKDITEK